MNIIIWSNCKLSDEKVVGWERRTSQSMKTTMSGESFEQRVNHENAVIGLLQNDHIFEPIGGQWSCRQDKREDQISKKTVYHVRWIYC